ncbi:glycine cleavage system H protein [Quadrisphaera granulorum]|uniref:Glycine cleavage system H protein n=1 Tax=Quadrisphaera granulorum TaxID=317664 RepID=A0A316ABR1_9ACTN|nr:glycine cleavage system protein GcvH [Quadrisphaera granulorum]PWJ54698.1 glycine cleavage system H protein [Quadrisphaera granulorum]SZE96060.1 glycine cleavage system H protein [Quadrisphaera granulorum]
MPDVEIPEQLRYTAEHEWVADAGDGVVRIGITAYAQGELGDIVYVSLPAVGDRVEAGSSCGELESTKSVSELYAPVTGEVTARNDSLDGSPELVNSDPYGEGWVLEVRLEDAAALDGLLDAAGYRDQIS